MFTIIVQRKEDQSFVNIDTFETQTLDTNVVAFLEKKKSQSLYTSVICPANEGIPNGWLQCKRNGKLVTLPSGDKPIFKSNREVILDTSALQNR